MFQNMIIDFLFLLAVTSLWLILLYHAFLAVVAYDFFLRCRSQTEKEVKNLKEFPFVSILVPCRNEEVVIQDTLDALLELDYPKDRLEIIMIDDQSTDGTARILERYAKQHRRVKAFPVPAGEGGRGKSHALNCGLGGARGEVIAVFDADNQPEPLSLRILVAELTADPRLAASSGKVRTINRNQNLLTRFINIEFISHQWMIQAGRWYLHKVALIPGTNFVIWRRYLEEAGRWDEKALTEDTELALRLIEKGYLISFNPLAITWEQEPQTWGVWYRQRMRWLQGNQYIVAKYFNWIFKGWRSCRVIIYMIGIYAALLAAVVLSDLLFLSGLFHLIAIRASGPLFLCWLFAFFLFVMTIYLTLSFEESRENTPRNLWVIVLMYFIYSQCWVALGVRSLFLPLERWKKAPFWSKTVRVKLGI